MGVRFVNTIVFVKDVNRSKEFYRNLLGLEVAEDHGTLVIFENRFAIHSSKSLMRTVFKKNIFSSTFRQGRRNLLIYFECDRLDDKFAEIVNAHVKLIHRIERQAWGQRVFRFYDPDNHIVEIGEPADLAEPADAR